MSSSFHLGLPTDIPWKRICVTEDMLDENACDKRFPPKWNSSIAVFEYVPEDAFQPYDDLKVTYLKVSATITGYQPQDKEVEGTIDWDSLDVDTIEDVESLLNEYLPCTGAILQVSVQPKNPSGVPLKDYPYFIDFEPKKRELYEMATDTKERVSRSLDTLSVGKSATTTESLEVLDIDMGSSWNVGANFTYAGTGGGISGGSSNQGQWGSRTVGTNQTAAARTSDRSQEERETHSFTTQISQLYHLFEAYHVGTNRAMFFVQPRPHVLEVPSGFVRGPRSIDGIQEVFLVVVQPKEQDGMCVSARLDTAHFTEVDILDYEYKKDSIDLSVSASPPTDANDPNRVYVGNEYLDVYFIGKIGERRYKCYQKTASETQNYIPPWSDYKIDVGDSGGYNVTSESYSHGSGTVSVAADGSSLTAKVEASSHVCIDDGGAVCVDCPDTIQKWSAHANMSLVVNLVSKQPIRKIGTEQVVVVTTRGLCCCPDQRLVRPDFGIVSVQSVDDLIRAEGAKYGLKLASAATVSDARQEATGPSKGPRPAERDQLMQRLRDKAKREEVRRDTMTAREANALGSLIGSELQRQAGPTRTQREPTPYLRSDLFATKLERKMRSSRSRRLELDKTVDVERLRISPEVLKRYTGKDPKEVKLRELAVMDRDFLTKTARLSDADAAKLRLEALGIRFRDAGSSDEGPTKPRGAKDKPAPSDKSHSKKQR